MGVDVTVLFYYFKSEAIKVLTSVSWQNWSNFFQNLMPVVQNM